MSAMDSFKIGPLTESWQNVWTLIAAKCAVDGIPIPEKFAAQINLEAPSANDGTVIWGRTSIGDNPAGELQPRESVLRQSGDYLVNENLFTVYVKCSAGAVATYLYVERRQ